MRLRIGSRGEVVLPPEILRAAELMAGSYIEIVCVGKKVCFEKIHFDPFAEAAKQIDPTALDKLLQKQKDTVEKARQEFEQKLRDAPKDPTELPPESRPEYWD